LVAQLTTPEQQSEVTAYVNWAKNRSERERQADVKKISGVFTGAYAIHPFTKKPIPIWVGDYVLAGYGTGAVMAVPAHDTRDYAFARHFNLPVLQVIEPPTTHDFTTAAYDEKNGTCVKSDFLNGLSVTQAIKAAIAKIETSAIGKGQVNYRQRDAVFGRQRYWGEPIPIYYVNGIAHTLPLENLPLVLPVVDAYLPTEQGEPPLARAYNFTYNGHPIETTTMPGWAGSSWYYLRYMDANNNLEFASEKAINYWQQIDLYLGGSEHATGHLLYVRFWTKFLYDLGYLPFNEPAKKLINQGMIQGTSAIVYRAANNTFISAGLKNQHQTTPLHADVNMVVNNVLDVEAFKAWRPEYANAQFVLEEGKYICGSEVEKMSKSKYNVVTPDDIIEKIRCRLFAYV
jgi:leucyl-tRNA synthetase